MKRLLFIMVSCLTTFHVLAEYVPFVVEGKTWDLMVKYQWLEGVEYIRRCELKGDTTINGIIYKKYYEDGTYGGAVREMGKKIFIFNGSQEYLGYDFNLKKDDCIYINENCIVVVDDSIVSCGRKLKRLGLYRESDALRQANYWIEGVGSLGGPQLPIYAGLNGGVLISLIRCYVGNQDIYHNKEVKVVSPLPTSPIGRGTDAVYDLQGRRLNARPQRGLYIQGGKMRMAW